jgi:hypothetical protein
MYEKNRRKRKRGKKSRSNKEEKEVKKEKRSWSKLFNLIHFKAAFKIKIIN